MKQNLIIAILVIVVIAALHVGVSSIAASIFGQDYIQQEIR